MPIDLPTVTMSGATRIVHEHRLVNSGRWTSCHTGVNATGTLGGVACRTPKTQESKRRRRRGVGSEEGLCPFPENLWIFHFKMVWYIADDNDSDLRYSELPLKGKNKTLVKILGSSTQDNPCRSNIGGSRPLQPLRRWHLWAAIQMYTVSRKKQDTILLY